MNAIIHMNHSPKLNDLGEQAILSALPMPPAEHPWYAAKNEAQKLAGEYRLLRAEAGRNTVEVNAAFSAFYQAQQVADRRWDEWRAEYHDSKSAA